jgi:hypothetical protein
MADDKPIALQFGISDLDRGDRSYFRRLSDDMLRKQGKFRQLVLQHLAAGKDPTRADLAAALRETPPDAKKIATVTPTPEERAELLATEPADYAARHAWIRTHITPERWEEAIEQKRQAIAADTARLCEHVARFYVEGKPRKVGRKIPPVEKEFKIAHDYYLALRQAKAGRDGIDGTRAVHARAKRQTAQLHKVSERKVERIIGAIKSSDSERPAKKK